MDEFIFSYPTSLFLDPEDLESSLYMARDLSWFTKSLSDLQHKTRHCTFEEVVRKKFSYSTVADCISPVVADNCVYTSTDISYGQRSLCKLNNETRW